MNEREKLDYIRKIDVINLYHLNKSSFPPAIVEAFEKNYNVLHFMFKVVVPFLSDLPDKVRELMMKQYPSFRNETRPALLKAIEPIYSTAGVNLIMGLANLMKAKGEGISSRENYAPFDKWVKENTYPEDTWEKVKDNERMDYGASDCTKEEWEAIKEEENTFREDEIEWIKDRRFEFIEVLQNTLLNHFEGFELLESDDLIVYSILLRSEYEDYVNLCEDIENFLDWGLPEEDFGLRYSELSEKQVALGNEKRWEVADMRYRRVYGEEI